MSDYKDTLNLPKTAFPMKANLPNREPKTLKRWQDMDLYQRLRSEREGCPSYILHDGPPYASGRPHMGTAMNKTVKDIITKSRSLSGFDAPFVPGWDCHGLPIELNVEKKYGKPGHKLSAAEFRVECRKYAQKQVDIQREDFMRLGVLADWKNPYVTMDFQYEADSIRVLSDIIDKGYLQRGFKPVHWCCACGSALAEAEVEYADKRSSAIDVAFSVANIDELRSRLGITDAFDSVTCPIWTTTPWTLPANQAVCVHAELEYTLVETALQGKTVGLVVASALLEPVLARYGAESHRVCAQFAGADLAGLKLSHPLFESTEVPVITGDHVTVDAGTGLVHTAPSHGVDDYVVGTREGLPVHSIVDSRGVYTDDVPTWAGTHVFKANDSIIETLKNTGKLLHHVDIEHSYPHCWRHKTPLMFRATPQWFIGMDEQGLRKQAVEQIEQTRWIPEWGSRRIEGMVTGRPDWCVSRQRVWGTPIAVFIDKQTQLPHPDSPRLMEAVAKLVDKEGIQAWYDVEPADLLGDDAEQYEKVTDVMDVWFDSGVTHYTVLQKRKGLHVPADLYFEGSDQHRGWFQSSLLTSVATRGTAPFKTVLTHGYVVDGKGRKMSKSLGNGMFPADVVKNLGADVLRLWAASTDHTVDIHVSDEILKRSSDAYRRLRNTARFLLGNLHDFDAATDAVAPDQLVAIDSWMLQQIGQLHTEILAAYEGFQLQRVYQLIHNFCSVTLGSFYLDVLKDRLYTASAKGVARRSAQTAMQIVLEYFAAWIAPILSFTAEEIWQEMPGARAESIFLTQWPTSCEQFPAASGNTDWVRLMAVRDAVNKALEAERAAGKIGSGLDTKVTVYANKEDYDQLSALGDELRFLLITSDAEVHTLDKKPAGASDADEGLAISVAVLSDEKCDRCWQRRADYGKDTAHPTLCGRCVVNVSNEAGEARVWI